MCRDAALAKSSRSSLDHLTRETPITAGDEAAIPSYVDRALAYAQAVTALAPGRGSATASEARAAGYVQEALATLGVPDVRIQSFQGLRSIWLFVALAYGTALTGHAAFWLLGHSISELPGLAISLAAFAFSAYLLWRKFTFQDYPLRLSLPHGPSQNVIAVIPPSEEPRHKVVMVGHLDSHRAVWWFASDFLVSLYALLTPVGLYGVFVAPLLYALSIFVHLPILSWIGLVLALPHFLAWFTGMTADLGLYSPGANDNASAVGTVLSLAERLRQHPLQHTETWLVFTGCEETGCDGMRTFLSEHGPALKDALFLDFELVGIGERLAYLRSEGMLRKRRISGDVERLVQSVGKTLPIEPLEAGAIGAFTEMGTVWEKGFQGVCLLVQRAGSRLAPEWHRLTDQSGRLQTGALDLAHRFAWEILKRIDTT